MTLFAKVPGLRFRCGFFCAVFIASFAFGVSAIGQETRDEPGRQLYLVSGTPGAEHFAVMLYRVDSKAKLQLAREVIPDSDGLAFGHAAGGILFFVHPQANRTSVSIIHMVSPMDTDDVVFNSNGFPVPGNGSAAAELPASPVVILLAMAENIHDLTHLDWKLASVSRDPAGPAPRVKFGDWDEFTTVRFDGVPGGPGVEDELSAHFMGNDIVVGPFGHFVAIDALPPAMQGAHDPKHNYVGIVAASDEYLVINTTNAPMTASHASKTLLVHDLVRDKWKGIQIEGGVSTVRLFGSWLATIVMDWNPDQKTSPGRGNEPPYVQQMYSDEDANYYYSGVLTLQNLSDGRKISIETGQEDSEVLWEGSDTVLYRVNDTIYQAQIVGEHLQDTTVVVKDDEVPEIHWAFWSK